MRDDKLGQLNTLRVFDVAARCLSYTRAAEELYLTQSAISRAIHILEAQLGVPLFQRRGPRVCLTAEGENFHRIVSESLRRIDAAASAVGNLPCNNRLTISSSPYFTSSWLIPRLSSLKKAAPDLSIDILGSETLPDFDIDCTDVAICLGSGQWPGMEATRLVDERVAVYCAPAYLGSYGKVVSVADLRTEALLIHTGHTSGWETLFYLSGFPAPDFSLASRFQQFDMVLEAAIHGLGFALMPAVAAEPQVRLGRLVRVLPEHSVPERAYYLVVPKRPHVPDKIALFKDWLFHQLPPCDNQPVESLSHQTEVLNAPDLTIFVFASLRSYTQSSMLLIDSTKSFCGH